MNHSKISELLRNLADEFDIDGEEAAEEKPKTTRRRKPKDDDAGEDAGEEKPKPRRRRSTRDKDVSEHRQKSQSLAAELISMDLRDDLSELLEEFGAENLSGLEEDVLKEFNEEAQAIIDEAEEG